MIDWTWLLVGAVLGLLAGYRLAGRRHRRRAGRWERAARACLRHVTKATSLRDAQVFCDLEVHHTVQTEKGFQ